jgi:CheY-like chemotaxis protein
MDGITAARKIRAMDGDYARTVPVIAVSADAYQENVQESLVAGMNAHISKPVDADELTRLICSLITTK